jgi:hypothetical protein
MDQDHCCQLEAERNAFLAVFRLADTTAEPDWLVGAANLLNQVQHPFHSPSLDTLSVIVVNPDLDPAFKWIRTDPGFWWPTFERKNTAENFLNLFV